MGRQRGAPCPLCRHCRPLSSTLVHRLLLAHYCILFAHHGETSTVQALQPLPPPQSHHIVVALDLCMEQFEAVATLNRQDSTRLNCSLSAVAQQACRLRRLFHLGCWPIRTKNRLPLAALIRSEERTIEDPQCTIVLYLHHHPAPYSIASASRSRLDRDADHGLPARVSPPILLSTMLLAFHIERPVD